MVYCENCGQDDLDVWDTLEDGTIVCSGECMKAWLELLKENRKESKRMKELDRENSKDKSGW